MLQHNEQHLQVHLRGTESIDSLFHVAHTSAMHHILIQADAVILLYLMK